jgi:glycosyltransferase involved in cell wall biosynthesis
VRVLLDATAVPPQRGGVGRYVDSLVPALHELGVDVRVACQAADVERYGQLCGQDPIAAGSAVARTPVRLAWEQVELPLLARRIAADVLHSPHYTHPLAARVPVVVTMHDATFFTDPHVHTAVKGPFFRAATRLSLRRAAACVVPSRATAEELVRVAGADRARLHVAHHGVDRTVFHPPADADVRALRSQLTLRDAESYIAFLGTLEPRKNLPALVEGWRRAATALPAPPALVLAGAAGWDRRLDDLIAGMPAPLRVIRPGYLPVEQLSALLGGATIVAYPSLGEGFGLPVLEAMACAGVVLTTRRLALPEVGGDAVSYTEPDAVSIGAALSSLLRDADRRADLARRAVSRAAGFTWEACARAHLPAYEQAAGLRQARRVPG